MPQHPPPPANRNGDGHSQSDLDYTLARYSLRAAWRIAQSVLANKLWKAIPADYVLELAPRELVDLLYPVPYRESLLVHAPTRGVDPRLVLSIARQESRFQPAAKSVAAARGLMQFIPETSDDVARQLGLSDFAQDNLYDPDQRFSSARSILLVYSDSFRANLRRLWRPTMAVPKTSLAGSPGRAQVMPTAMCRSLVFLKRKITCLR